MDWLECLQSGVDKCYTLWPRAKPTHGHVPKLVAHRGIFDKGNPPSGVKENTFSAFDKAREAGVWGIELDIHQSRDGHFIVHHDETLSRLWGDERAIAKLSLAEIKACSQQVPSLSEVIERYAQSCHLFIELKTPLADEARLKQVLSALTPCEDYHFLSLDETHYQNLSGFPKEAMLLVPLVFNVKAFCRLCETHGYGGVMGHYLLMSRAKLRRLKRAHKLAGVGYIDSKNQLHREMARSVDFIFSNNGACVATILKDI